MKSLFCAAVAAASLQLLACGAGGGNGADGGVQTDAGQQAQTFEVTSDISTDTTWATGNTYVLQKHVFVKAGTLTIEPGVVVKGGEGTSLVITENARLEAVGTAQAPIVFTSAKAEGSRAAGDWGGVVLLGKASLNVAGGRNKVEGFPASAESPTDYGGSDDAHDCGTLRYARIEFAGFQLAPDNELNGLTVGGCGTGTELSHIQVHQGADDGVEMFGGTAALRNIVVTQPDDDALDWDFGYRGTVQFLIIQQNALVGNAGFESDSNGGSPDALPRSSPELWNATLIGSGAAAGMAGKTQLAMHLRRGTAAKMSNFVIAHFADGIIDVDGEASVAQLQQGNLYLKNSVLFSNGGATTSWPAESKDNDNGLDEAAEFMKAEWNNAFADPKLNDPRNLASPNFAPAPDSALLSGGGTPPAGFDTGATFRGAIGTSDWTQGWTAYPQN